MKDQNKRQKKKRRKKMKHSISCYFFSRFFLLLFLSLFLFDVLEEQNGKTFVSNVFSVFLAMFVKIGYAHVFSGWSSVK